MVLGFESFDPELDLAGVVFNRVAGDAHWRWLREAVTSRCRTVPLGYLPHRKSLALPERHLGLVTAAERRLPSAFLDELSAAMGATIDLDRLLGRARSGVPPSPSIGVDRSPRTLARIGVARDLAFQFYYPANFDLLRAAGGELVFWSPLEDRGLPDVDALYLGGGYPEVHARELASNVAMREAVRAFAAAGGPVYAECGGLLYLAEGLEDESGRVHPMVGLLPTIGRMTPKHLTLGYAEVETTRETPLGPAGTTARGHMFHASRIDPVPEWVPRAYSVRAGQGAAPRAEGYLIGEALLSYVHLHFGSNLALANRLVRRASARRRRRAAVTTAVASPQEGQRHE
jgi:cobyrinic acid a,c-diamide synthase